MNAPHSLPRKAPLTKKSGHTKRNSTSMKTKTHSDSQRLYDLLLGARTADKATLYFKDGRIMHGALIFNPFKGTGRLINIDQEISLDFAVDDLRDLKL
jgi:hypothetical protein